MLLLEKEIEINITPQNRKYYEYILNKPLKNKDVIQIKQDLISKTSRVQVECQCDFCHAFFSRKRVDVHSLTFCNKNCRNENLKLNNPNPTKEKIEVNCTVCNKSFSVFESKYKNQEHFLCSRECYKKHRSLLYNGENIYNYQNLIVECEYCHQSFKVSQFDKESRNHLFCSPECYWNHRKENYNELYYSASLNDSRKETTPEQKVREWLENNDIVHVQEFGFMKKYYIDFYIPKYKSFIEVFGDYWHVNPNIFGEGKNLKPLTSQQIGKQENDLKRIQEIESYGYKVYVIWESEIKDNIDLYMGKIIDDINKNPQRLHA